MKIEFPVVIVGLGKSGLSAARLLKSLYPNETIKTYDAKDLSADFSTEVEVVNFKPKTLVVSPGVPLRLPWIQKLISSGVSLESELSLAFSHFQGERVIAITGSMGKSTTTSLLGEAVHCLNENNFVGGNLGFPLADYVFEVLFEARPRADWVVLELSSYQLENFKNLSAAASVLTALSPNHLERYDDLDHYYQTKLSLVDKTTGSFFLNGDNSEIRRWLAGKARPQFVWVNSKSFEKHSMKMVGLHNRENLSLALAVSQHFNWGAQAEKVIENYPGLPHRLEFVGEAHGVTFINDSKATTIESVLAAVKSCLPSLKFGGTLHLLVGGRDKNLPWKDLSSLSRTKNLKITYFGECRELARAASGIDGPLHPDLRSAFDAVIKLRAPGDLVLLSPGGSSLDEFKNFEDRGEAFKSLCRSFSQSKR